MSSSPPFPFRESPTAMQDVTPSLKTGLEPVAWGVCLSSTAVLAGVLGLRWACDWGQDLGGMSEEIFRGDRLPLLPSIPVGPTPTSEADAAPTIL